MISIDLLEPLLELFVQRLLGLARLGGHLDRFGDAGRVHKMTAQAWSTCDHVWSHCTMRKMSLHSWRKVKDDGTLVRMTDAIEG